MKTSLIQLLAGLIGAGILCYSEYKTYIQNHPEVISTLDLQKHQMQPIQYYMYQVAYDPNNNKTWYLYNDGLWYDKPPQIQKRENQGQRTMGNVNGPSGGSVHGNGQSPQASTHTQRY